MRFSSENWLMPLENSRIWRREALQDMMTMMGWELYVD